MRYWFLEHVFVFTFQMNLNLPSVLFNGVHILFIVFSVLN